MFSKAKILFERIWTWFLSLKRWQQVVVVIILLGAVLSAGGDSPDNPTSNSVTKAQATPSPEPTPEVSEEPTPTPIASRTPETPIEFRFSALRDLGDIRKDLNDARVGITQNGLAKFYWNVAEVNINLVQLEMLEPREQYAEKWNSKLEILKSAVRALGEDDEELTITKAKAKLDKVLNTIPALEAIARSLAN